MGHPAPECVRILHVDDEPDFLELAATCLEREAERFEVETETEAKAVLDCLADDEFDCIVSDYDMPRMDGLELLEEVRGEYPDLPFILFTGKGSEEIASEAVSAGVTDYLQKASTVDQYTVLANRVENAVSQHRAERRLSHTRQRYEQLVSRSTDIIIVFDREGRMEYVSPACERILGFEPQELVGEYGLDYVRPSDREAVREGFARVAAGETETAALEFRTRTADDDWVWIESGFRNLLDDPTIGGIVGYARDATERMRARQRREEERERREALFENPSDVIVEIEFEDKRPLIQEVNEAFTDVFGYDADAVVGEPVAETIVPVDDAAQSHHDEIVADVLGGEPVETEVRRRTASGVREFMLRVFPIDVADGRDASYAIYTDITSHRDYERTLEALHDVATEMGGHETVEAVCERTVEAADALLDFRLSGIGLAADGWLVPTAISDETEEGEFPRMRTDEGLAGQTYRTGEPSVVGDLQDVEAVDVGNDQHRSLLSVPVGNEGVFQAIAGEPDAFGERDLELAELLLAHTAEALDRIERERELEQYETIVEASGDPVYILDERGCVEFVNDSFVEMTGYGKDELQGEHVSLFMDERDIEAPERRIQALLESEQDQATVEIGVRTDDDERLICESHFALLSSDGTFDGTVGVLRDVTDRKERERDLARQNERLDEFASIVGHDLRTPLGLVQGGLELAREECDSEHLETVDRGLQRMGTLLDDLLDLARAGETVSDLERIELRRIARRAWGSVDTPDAALDTATNRPIRADPSRLQQLFENLFRNAVEHGGEDVRIRTGDLADGNGFYVTDDGPGIAADDRERVFESGYSTRDGGTGLGLAIVREIVEAHGWSIAIGESETGGARFEISGVEVRP